MSVPDPDFFEWETHIFFDDAFEPDDTGKLTVVNQVQQPYMPKDSIYYLIDAEPASFVKTASEVTIRYNVKQRPTIFHHKKKNYDLWPSSIGLGFSCPELRTFPCYLAGL